MRRSHGFQQGTLLLLRMRPPSSSTLHPPPHPRAIPALPPQPGGGRRWRRAAAATSEQRDRDRGWWLSDYAWIGQLSVLYKLVTINSRTRLWGSQPKQWVMDLLPRVIKSRYIDTNQTLLPSTATSWTNTRGSSNTSLESSQISRILLGPPFRS